jgi:hypothetical protein
LLQACRFEGDRRASAELGEEGKVVFKTVDSQAAGESASRVVRGVLLVSLGNEGEAESQWKEWRIAVTMLFH